MYFEATNYPFRRPPELDGAMPRFDVAVAGGGPVGLALAIGLANRNLNVTVLEARNSVSSGSRAITLDRRSIQLLDRLGVGAAYTEIAVPRRRSQIFMDKSLVHETRYEKPAAEKHEGMMTLQQCWLEHLLLARLLEMPNAEVRWLSRVTSVVEDGEAVRIKVDSPDGNYDLMASYAVAADGARGNVRGALNLEYENVVSDVISQRRFVVCDFEMEASLEPGRRLWLSPDDSPDSVTILHSQPFDIWRLDYAMDDKRGEQEQLEHSVVSERLSSHLRMMGLETKFKVLWASSYRPLARVLPGFRFGRVLFAGDAAHQTPIFGGRGLNLGLGDVSNLEWKLAFVLSGQADPTLLSTYDVERRGIANRTLSELSQSAIFMANPSRGTSLMRSAVLGLAKTEPFVRELFDGHHAKRQEAYTIPYAPRPDDPKVGMPLLDILVERTGAAGRASVHLYDLLPDCFAGVYLSRDGKIPERLRSIFNTLEKSSPAFKGIVVGGPDSAAAAIDPTGIGFDLLEVAESLFILVRPDRFVCGIWEDLDEAEIKTVLMNSVNLGDEL